MLRQHLAISRQFIGAACLCGVGDTLALLLADQAFAQGLESAIAKIGVLIGSVLAAGVGVFILAFQKVAVVPALAPAAPAA